MSDSPAAPPAGSPEDDDNLIYFNGIDGETGQYAVAPRTIDDMANIARGNPRLTPMTDVRGETPTRAFGLPPGVDYQKLDEAGWGVIFHENAAPEIQSALEPLLAIRKKAAGALYKALDYKTGEQTRDWYRRHDAAPGQSDPDTVPYYLLIVGAPDDIPFEFQYLLGVDYAVGRLSFATADEYARYAESIARYESAAAIANAKKIAYWGTRHVGDGATQLSSTQLIGPLANGDPARSGRLGKPAHAAFGFDHELFLADAATKDALRSQFGGDRPPALVFTASHGMQFTAGGATQQGAQGALLCQDWSGFGRVSADDYLAASDIADDANVGGMVAFFFACFAAGTPKADQFFLKAADMGTTLPPLAPQPFVAALPRRLLGHPKGSALAVIGHIDRAWGYSIQSPGMAGSQIIPFRSGLGFMMSGDPVGHVVKDQFGGRFAALSAELSTVLAPNAPKISDRDLVTYWLERNDAQNYVVLGDPAARLRVDKLS
jgi:hypothetical protein